MILDGVRRLSSAARAFAPDTRRFLAGMFLLGLGRGAMDVHLNLYLKALGLDERVIGEVLSATSAGVVAVSLPAALWADRLRPSRLFLFTGGGFVLGLLGLVLLPPDPMLLRALSFLVGGLFAVHWVAEGPFFMRTEGPEHRTELFGIAHAIETLAMIATAWGTGALAEALARRLGSETAGLRWAIAAAAAATLFAAVPYANIATPASRDPPKGWREYVVPRQAGLVFRLSLPTFLVGCGAGLSIPFLNLYFRDRFGLSPGPIGGLFSVAQVLTMGGFLLGPVLARRYGHVRAAVATELLSIPFFFVLAVTDHLGAAVGAFWMRSALMNMNQPISSVFAMEIVDPDQQVVLNSVKTFAWNASWMLSAVVGGRIIERTEGYEAVMFTTMGLYLAAAAFFWSFFRGRTVGESVRAVEPR
ncbi:MAG TPA: MFS transporter [Planctomycetota bacterium]|nr:MFS transporter [Planctomycetota bacterium]